MDAFAPNQSPAAAPGTKSFGVGALVSVPITGIRVALPTDNQTSFDLNITNLGAADVGVVFGTNDVTCTVFAGANPGIPVMTRTRLVLSKPDSATHIYLIAEGASAVNVMLSPGRSGSN